MNSVRRAIFMLSVLLISLTLPNAVAWRADGWLIQEVVGGERLALGDEFGCHGMPGQSVEDDIAVIDECKDYLSSQINASRWGEEPLSFGIPMDNLDTLTYNTMHNSGFRIVGDQVETNTDGYLWSIERNAGSLEQSVASKTMIEEAIEQDGYASLYWEARIADLNVRRDRDVVSWIDSQDYWFTTWGEWYSSNHMATEVERTSESITLKGSTGTSGGWDVPGNTLVTITGGEFTSVERIDDGTINQLTLDNNHLMSGYRILNGTGVALTIPSDALVQLTWEGVDVEIQIMQGTFNNFPPFIAVGHHTYDLFEWSSPFQDSQIRFTWLIEPQPDVQPSWILPILAVLVVLAVPIAVRSTLAHDKAMYPYPEEE
jgi:hypothetical protein